MARARGQAVVEFGIVILLLLLIVGAATDVALLVAARQTIGAVTGEAARQVAYGSEPKDAMAVARSLASGSIVKSGAIGVSITYCRGPSTALPCPARSQSYCTNSPTPPAPPSSAISGYQGCFSDPNALLPTSGSAEPLRGDWALVVLTDSSWELFTPLTRTLATVYASDCAASDKACLTTIQVAQLVVYPGVPPPPPPSS
jgi:hypothetical protein